MNQDNIVQVMKYYNLVNPDIILVSRLFSMLVVIPSYLIKTMAYQKNQIMIDKLQGNEVIVNFWKSYVITEDHLVSLLLDENRDLEESASILLNSLRSKNIYHGTLSKEDNIFRFEFIDYFASMSHKFKVAGNNIWKFKEYAIRYSNEITAFFDTKRNIYLIIMRTLFGSFHNISNNFSCLTFGLMRYLPEIIVTDNVCSLIDYFKTNYLKSNYFRETLAE